jgi:uncharacterized membrane protein YfcA
MLAMLILGLLLSGAIGLSLGLIGGGGSIITVPVLVYVLGVDAHQAIGMSLAVVGATSVVGSALHARSGAVDFRTGVLFGLSGVLGAFYGSRLTYLLPASTLMLLFAGLMISVAAAMLFSRRHTAEGEAPRARSTAKAVAAGLGVGVMTGFLGVGGGFLIVPALILFGGLTMKDAIGTSLVVIAINCVAGLAGHLQHGGFDPQLAVLVTVMAAAGALVGTAISHRASPARLKTGFALFVIVVAVFLIAKNYTVLL